MLSAFVKERFEGRAIPASCLHHIDHPLRLGDRYNRISRTVVDLQVGYPIDKKDSRAFGQFDTHGFKRYITCLIG